MENLTLITVAYHRNKHLKNLLRGISKNSIKPDEVILVDIDATANVEIPDDIKLRKITVKKKQSGISLAKARNLAAAKASGKYLIFLDVDCIPAPFALERMLNYVEDCGGIVMANSYFLKSAVDNSFDRPLFKDVAIPHPERPRLKCNIQESNNYDLFWSSGFAISKRDFMIIGGFDSNFEGNGAEDTDFALEAKSKGIPFYLSDAIVYHQHHKVYSPPIQHFDEIVSDSNRFYQKWNKWPMERWLNKFKEHSLIEWNPETGEPIKKAARPEV